VAEVAAQRSKSSLGTVYVRVHPMTGFMSPFGRIDGSRDTEVTWRQGSKGAMTSWFAVLAVRPAGKQSLAAAQGAGGGRNRWDGVLPTRTLLVEWPNGQDAPTDYWISNMSATTPAADLVRWAKMRWRIEHDYRELKHGLGLDHFEGSTWRGWHHHVTLVTAAQAFLTLRRLDPKVRTPA
jgi:SRSO17 transposase